ncbi:MAG: hypothetical protein U0804_13390 [Gemmataceae bacterium]
MPAPHGVTYARFLRRSLHVATDGGWPFYAWMLVLTAVALVGANAWAVQVRDGMARTNMSDHVSWGLYIANFTFCVGLAAGGVMMVIPAYLYHDHDMHEAVEYAPSATEWKVTAGIWAFGLLLLTAMLTVSVAVFTDQLSARPAVAAGARTAE